jgi:hypothetical protein
MESVQENVDSDAAPTPARRAVPVPIPPGGHGDAAERTPRARRPIKRAIRIAVFAIIFLTGLWMRGGHLSKVPPTGDESETAINALTILDTGLPRGTYLQLPIYENVLTEPWPGHPEYEFRDSSYSNRDVAIYHGWLPIYAIACSFKAFGIEPDHPSQQLTVRHTEAEVHKRVMAARLPAVVFGGAFMVFLFLAGWEMYGPDAAWSAMLVGAVGRPFVYMGRESRYHSATLALTTACCWSFWRVRQYGRWRDYLIAAVCMVLLFYTHLLAFAIASIMFATIAISRFRRPGEFKRLVVMGAITAACTAPWLIGSGFLQQHTHIPPARAFLVFPLDLIWYPLLHVPYLLLPLVLLIWPVFVVLMRRRLPAQIVQPVWNARWTIAFLTCWILMGLLVFTFLIPAASYFYKRLTLPVAGIGLIWGAVVISAAMRAVTPRFAAFMAPTMFAMVIVTFNMANLWFLEKPDRVDGYVAVEHLRNVAITPDTKLYCTPNEQLTLVFLAGIPVQSVAPIRKQYIDSYPGPLLIIDSSRPYGRLDEDHVRGVAWQNGIFITEKEASAAAGKCYMRAMREYVAPRVASVDPPLIEDPPFAQAVVDSMKREMDGYIQDFYKRGTNSPLLRGFTLRDWGDWWPLFFYRFVDPRSRMGDKLNYADRIRTARAEVLPTGWAIYHCPRRGDVK